MLQRINDDNFDPDIISEIDMSKNIIICTPSNNNIINENIDGSISICNTHKHNLTAQIIEQNNYVHLQIHPKIKMSIPKGIIPEFVEPIDKPYIFKVYKKIDCYQNYETENEFNLSSSTPNYLSWQNFNLDVVIDAKKLIKTKKILELSEREKILTFYFKYIYFPGSTQKIPEILNTYYIQHNELYNQFLMTI